MRSAVAPPRCWRSIPIATPGGWAAISSGRTSSGTYAIPQATSASTTRIWTASSTTRFGSPECGTASKSLIHLGTAPAAVVSCTRRPCRVDDRQPRSRRTLNPIKELRWSTPVPAVPPHRPATRRHQADHRGGSQIAGGTNLRRASHTHADQPSYVRRSLRDPNAVLHYSVAVSPAEAITRSASLALAGASCASPRWRGRFAIRSQAATALHAGPGKRSASLAGMNMVPSPCAHQIGREPSS